MSMTQPGAMGSADDLARQIPIFALVGLIGFGIDSSLTYALAHGLGIAPALARPPAVLAAMSANFLANRRFTFAASNAPLLPAFTRYALVSALGTAINYAVYCACLALAPVFCVQVTPAMLPLFIAVGVAAAMAPTFLGFKRFAFAPATD